jgi:glycine dehydrogenase subunit 2
LTDMDKKLIFEKKSSQKKDNYFSSSLNSEELLKAIPDDFKRNVLDLPSLGELDAVRHYSNLSDLSFSVDKNFYPLGSCTMKYNPKINEDMASLEGFTGLHPYQSESDTQGALELMFNLQELLCKVTGMKRFTLQPASGAHGELTGMLMIKKYHELKGNKKTKVIVPDSAHGTNPATAAMCGYDVVVVESGADGLVDINKLRAAVDSETAAIMLTNPNTLGLFEERILDIADIVHNVGGLLYYDGANFNAMFGVTTPAQMGFDVVHLNLHKSFATPHGCGGPGAGTVGVGTALYDFLPAPIVSKVNNKFYLDYSIKNSIGRVRAFYGNFSVLVRAYTYLLRLGKEGCLRVAQNAVLNANYIKAKLKSDFLVPYDKTCMHEVVFSCINQKEKGVAAMDIAKALIDYGIHPPTMYFPMIVKEALMVEPTETESKETMDDFIRLMKNINQEINTNPEKVHNAPYSTPISRADEVLAARSIDIRWKKSGA